MSDHNDGEHVMQNDIAHVMDGRAISHYTVADDVCVCVYSRVIIIHDDMKELFFNEIKEKNGGQNKSASFCGRNNVDGSIYMHISFSVVIYSFFLIYFTQANS